MSFAPVRAVKPVGAHRRSCRNIYRFLGHLGNQNRVSAKFPVSVASRLGFAFRACLGMVPGGWNVGVALWRRPVSSHRAISRLQSRPQCPVAFLPGEQTEDGFIAASTSQSDTDANARLQGQIGKYRPFLSPTLREGHTADHAGIYTALWGIWARGIVLVKNFPFWVASRSGFAYRACLGMVPVRLECGSRASAKDRIISPCGLSPATSAAMSRGFSAWGTDRGRVCRRLCRPVRHRRQRALAAPDREISPIPVRLHRDGRGRFQVPAR